ncbi:MAG: S9 family peptidase [Tannerellaceae bacterium]|jgi:dipeptidyl aminopeptidase/acylaminoacyl peptidase|nr:S9 family peptidase [Tannerellaceae bacterium]
MRYKNISAGLILCLFAFSPLQAQPENASAGEKKPVGIDFFTQVYSISNLKEKNGNIFFTLSKPDKETNTYPRHLYQLIDGEAVRLSQSNISDYFFWEDDIVFRGNRDEAGPRRTEGGERPTVFQKLSPNGYAEASEWLRLPFAAGQIEWIDKEHFFYTSSYNHHAADAGKNYYILDELPFWSNGRGFTSGTRTHLYYYNKGQRTLLTDTLGTASGFVLSPDKKTLIYTEREAYYGKARREGSRLVALDVETLQKSDVILPEKTSGGGVQFISNDEILLTLRPTGQENENGDDRGAAVYRLLLKTGQATKVFEPLLYDLGNSIGSDIGGGGGSPITWDKTGIRFVTTDADHAPLIHVDFKDAHVTFLSKDKVTIREYLPYKEGFLVIALVGQRGSEIYFLNKKGELSPLTSINTRVFDEHQIIHPIEISFTNEEGRKLNGYVLPPVGYEKGKKYPAILDIHGGPRSAYGIIFFHEMQYWANQGYAVFFTNPTGSAGRGYDFGNLRGKFGTIDYRDLMSFTDAVLEQTDFIDETRLGVTGGSYGGFMTNWIIGHTDRFKAAASQRCASSWISYFTTADIGYTFTSSNLTTDPWKGSDLLWERSPLKYADQVKTPTLFIHSEEDYRCPLSEGLQMYYALQYFEVPTRMVIFKDEDHNLSRSGKPVNRIKRIDEITQWFDKYLK